MLLLFIFVPVTTDGYVCIAFMPDANGIIYVYAGTDVRYGSSTAYSTGNWTETMISTQKGIPIIVQYGGTLAVQYFRFIYAIGTAPTA